MDIQIPKCGVERSLGLTLRSTYSGIFVCLFSKNPPHSQGIFLDSSSHEKIPTKSSGEVKMSWYPVVRP